MHTKSKNGKDIILAHEAAREAEEAGMKGYKTSGTRAATPT